MKVTRIQLLEAEIARLTEALQTAHSDLEVLRREYCGHCGQLFLDRACGPTHAMIAAERRAALRTAGEGQ